MEPSMRNRRRLMFCALLMKLRSKIAAIDAKLKHPGSTFTYDEGNEENWRIEAAAIERRLGLRANAGLDYAIDLLHSDCGDRLLAAQILSDIPTAEARGYLITLSRDHCRLAASAAQQLLKSGRPPHRDAEFSGNAVSFKQVEAVAAQQQ